MKMLQTVWRSLQPVFRPLPTWELQDLVYITTITGQSYRDAYFVWQRFCMLPEVYSITYSVLVVAKQRNLPVDQALSYYIRHLNEPVLMKANVA